MLKRYTKLELQLLIFSIVFMLLGLMSCSSRDNETSNITNGTVLQVNVTGILDNVNVSSLTASASKYQNVNYASLGTTPIVKEKMLTVNGFDVLVSADAQISSENKANNAIASTSQIARNEVAAASPMIDGIKYRLLIYDTADTNHTTPVSDIVLTSGTAPSPPINIDAGKNYNWYAYSINEVTLPVATNGTVSKDALKNKDVLLANGNLTTQYGTNNLNITFKRNTTRLNIIVDSRGMFGSMANNPLQTVNFGSNNLLKYGDLNIFTGEYTNINTYTVTDVAPVNTFANARKTYSIYTIDKATTIPANGIQVAVQSTDIVKKDPLGGADVTVTVPNSAIGLNNTAFTTAYGNSYNLNLNFIESGVKVGGISWARSNLSWILNFDPEGVRYFDPNPDRAYYVKNPADPKNPNSCFYLAQGEIGWDYCDLAYPKGTWRQPTIQELRDTFTNRPYNTYFRNSTNNDPAKPDGMGGIEYELDPGSVINPAYPKLAQKLFFPIAGEIESTTTYQNHAFLIPQTTTQVNNLHINLMSKGNDIIFRWTASYNKSTGITVNNTSDFIQPRPAPNSNDNYSVYNVRCVRAK
ncbi:hypothetical protein [Elizabethkingia ursingii]|uniref:hypothetical protein n=1 Tax=Elizabethkingia ursingii TaxID=1756150 RepID=UPI0010548360|nr:hypothetical protein [Elizabethkingia ursingii]